LGLALLAAPAYADGPPRLVRLKVGLPDGAGDNASGRTRNGAWAPVYVSVEAPAGCPAAAYRVALRSTDSEDMTYQFFVPVPELAAGRTETLLGYLRPGNLSSEFSAVLQDRDGRELADAPRLTLARNADQEVLGPRDVLVLALGGRVPGLKRALGPRKNADDPGGDADPEGPMRSLATVEDFERLPDRWFGYDPVDLVVLATSQDPFMKKLAEDQTGRRQALIEWVRRGGRLVLAAGRNRERARELLEREMPLLAIKVGADEVKGGLLEALAAWSGAQGQARALVPLTDLPAGPGVGVLVQAAGDARDPPNPRDRRRRPVLVQAPFGLGRVVAAAFDLDARPFADEGFKDGQRLFWEKLLDEMDVRPGVAPMDPNGQAAELKELADRLQNQALEEFGDELPRVDFGWVAVFILLYILVVGPLDYFILKKVFKRLEWTWITFPLVVVVVSVAAYFTAYALKGEDLCVNQVDVVEVDLHAPQVYGTSWFTLFSPRIQTFTAGVEPAPGWAAADKPQAVVALLEGPDRTGRQGSQPLFRQPYAYAADAAAVERVPAPVWATRSFTATWRAPFDKDKPPFEAALQLRNGKPSGAITSNVPVPLRDAVLFYKGQWRPLSEVLPKDDPLLRPGQPCRIDQLFAEGRQERNVKEWIPDLSTSDLRGPQAADRLLRAALFYAEGAREKAFNSGLRRLDQSWRLRPLPPRRDAQPGDEKEYPDEAILVARTGVRAGKAQQLTDESAAPTRLVLDPALTGYLTQEAVVRVYIPITRTP
jgi:hypothetical protein